MQTGRITKVAGPLVQADRMEAANIQDMCQVGQLGLIGEIIEMRGDVASIQVYEETTGLGIGEPVITTGEALSVELGPGILGQMFDGIQRPLDTFMEVTKSDYFTRGVHIDPLNRSKIWHYTPQQAVGSHVTGGDILGSVQETPVVNHKVMVPPGVSGELIRNEAGDYQVTDNVYEIKTAQGIKSFSLMQKWAVRKGRPYAQKMNPQKPLITGQRVIDTFFPLTKGGAAAVPGPFGAGKTVVQHQIAKWANADIIVYVGCGERGNEMTDVINEFAALIDPKTHESLLARTVLIANTSNMPVAAREASIYTGITLAEYYRDMGYSVAIMADSTSRWAEALREMSGRLEEMPGDEGYPAYLGSRIAEYYERAGLVTTLGNDPREGSISAIGAVSPPGGDISEPVTQNTLRIVKVFWGLDAILAQQRHFPSINWLTSYSLYSEVVGNYLDQKLHTDWQNQVKQAMRILKKEDELQEIVRLVGVDALSSADRLVLETAKSIREDYLQQNAFDDVDAYTSFDKQIKMLTVILTFYEAGNRALKLGAYFSEVMKGSSKVRSRIARAKYVPENEIEKIDQLIIDVKTTVQQIIEDGGTNG